MGKMLTGLVNDCGDRFDPNGRSLSWEPLKLLAVKSRRFPSQNYKRDRLLRCGGDRAFLYKRNEPKPMNQPPCRQVFKPWAIYLQQRGNHRAQLFHRYQSRGDAEITRHRLSRWLPNHRVSVVWID